MVTMAIHSILLVLFIAFDLTMASSSQPLVTPLFMNRSLTTTIISLIVPSKTLTGSTKVATTTKCILTPPAPTCEYGVSSWCSSPLPPFNDLDSCRQAHTACILQIAPCFGNLGWPASTGCYAFKQWCDDVSVYCVVAPGPNKAEFLSENAPANSPATTPGVCTATATPVPGTVTPPIAVDICNLPGSNPYLVSGSRKEPPSFADLFAPYRSVASIDAPLLTCNNMASDFDAHPFKLYSTTGSTSPTYSRANVAAGCRDACRAQFGACYRSYAQSFKTLGIFRFHDAISQCRVQEDECLAVNLVVNIEGRCGAFNAGWAVEPCRGIFCEVSDVADGLV